MEKPQHETPQELMEPQAATAAEAAEPSVETQHADFRQRWHEAELANFWGE